MEAGASVHPRYNIPPNGLTVIVKPEEPDLDVVFIHGFTGHPERTWTHKNSNYVQQNCDGEEPPTKLRRINVFSKSRKNSSTSYSSVYWPRDLLPTTLPTARIFTYGYDTRIKHVLGSSPNTNTVYDIGWDLLVALEGERRCDPDRPLIFIVHSLGGIVVKEMLRRSDSCMSGQAHLHSICSSTKAVVFFGTPHGGADPRGPLQKALEGIIKVMGFSANHQIVETLLPSSERLKELRDHFAPMARKYGWLVHSFQESVGLKVLNGNKVVNDTSSYISCPDIEVTEHISLNHMDMCRFPGIADAEYLKVVRAISRVSGCISGDTTSSSTTQDDEMPSPERCTELLKSLRFEQMDARHGTIKKAYAKTCRWFLTQPDYIKWLDSNKYNEHNGFFWVKANPGTGKSTLMKYLLNQAQRSRNSLVLSFFFNARGDTLEKNTQGMYRSLLLQLLERDKALQPACFRLIRSPLPLMNDWGIEVLKELLEYAITNYSGSTTLFIDALDECDESEVREMLSFFNQLGETAVERKFKLFICFSSRHYPHITIRKGIQLVLEREEGHSKDIASYLSSELGIGQSKLAETIRAEVLQKASGIFMWVVLVVKILNKEYDHGQIHTLRKTLQDIPEDLHRLFEAIIERDERNRGQLLACIQLVLFAQRPLSREELYHAILASTDIEALSSVDANELTTEVIDRFVLSASKGLAEVTRSKKPTVQFIHESVRDFLLKHGSVPKIWSEYNTNFPGKSHSKLASCCLAYLKLDIESSVPIPDLLHKASSTESKQLRESLNSNFPFLKYALDNVFHHADHAQASGVCQKSFLHSFPLSRWVSMDNALARYDARRYEAPSLCYILAEYNAANLIRIDDSYDPQASSQERYKEPILAAVAFANTEAIDALLVLNYPGGDTDILLRDHRLRGTKEIRPNLSLYPAEMRSNMHHLAMYGDSSILDYLVSTGALTINDFINEDDSLLVSYAISTGKSHVLRYVLETYPDHVSWDSTLKIVRMTVRFNDYDLLLFLWSYNSKAVAEAWALCFHGDIQDKSNDVMDFFRSHYRDMLPMQSRRLYNLFQTAVKWLDRALLDAVMDMIPDVWDSSRISSGFDVASVVATATGFNQDSLGLILDKMELSSCVGKGLLPILAETSDRYLPTIIKLLCKGIHADEMGPGNHTALQMTVNRGPENGEIAHCLLKAGADPNIRWYGTEDCYGLGAGFGGTLLHTAIERLDASTISRLCHYDADINAQDLRGHTPAEFARSLERFEMARLIENAGHSDVKGGWCTNPGRTDPGTWCYYCIGKNDGVGVE